MLEQTIRMRAPLFQRPYVWTAANWEPLWESIRVVADRLAEGRDARPHFLGAIVLEQELAPMGGVGDVRRIIDGQQRLTTLQILLAVLRDLANAGDLKFQAQTFDRLVRNHTANQDEQFKVVPTTDDREEFAAVLNAGSRMKVEEAFGNSTERLLAQCYLFLGDQVMDWLKAISLERGLELLARVIQQFLVVVAIELDGREDDAQQIFETLNTKGEQLLPADLVKNFLLQAAEAEGLGESELRGMYERYWREFDRDARYWRKKIRQGRLFAPRMNTFLQHYLTLKRRDEVLASTLFSEFRVLARGRPVEKQLSELQTYASSYRSMDEPAPDTREHQFLYRLRELDVTTFHPIVIETFRRSRARELSAQVVNQILLDIESYLVRRAICGLTTKSYNRLVVELVRHVGDDWTADAIREFLLGQRTETTVWPTDRDIRRAWMSAPLYKGKRARVRLILEALDEAMRDLRSEKMKINEKLTVEHLMPQKWEQHWPLDGGTEKSRDRVVHTIGNLTLLTKVLNPGISNGPWPRKIEKILEHSALALNRELGAYPEWNEAQIEARADRLFDLAIRIWPRPDDSRGEDALADVELSSDREEPLNSKAMRRAEAVAAVIARIRELHGDAIAQMVEEFVRKLKEAQVSVIEGRSSLRGRLKIEGQTQRLSLFFIDTDGRVKFGWMRTGQLAELGLPDSFADDYYAVLAERFDVPLKRSAPDGLTLERLSRDPELFTDAVTDFANSVRGALASDTEIDDEDEDDDGDG